MEMMPDEEFNLLAALQALDTIDESESRALEKILKESPQLESELTAVEAAIAAIAYTAPAVAVALDLKNRLFQRIAESVNSELVAEPHPNSKPPHFIRRSHDVKWKPFGVPGISIGRLFTDTKKREITCLMRIEPGIEFPRHRHGGVEEIFMLEGDLVVEGEVCHQGDYIRSVPGSIHSPITQSGCLLLVKSSLDNEMLV